MTASAEPFPPSATHRAWRRAYPPAVRAAGGDREPPVPDRPVPATGALRSSDKLALALATASIILSVVGAKLGAGPVPLRSVTLIACGGVLLLSDARALFDGMRMAARPLMLIVALGLLGLAVSLAASTDVPASLGALVEDNVQFLLCTAIAAGLIRRVGVAPVMLAILVAWGISSLFVIGQALHIDAAWRARAELGTLMQDMKLDYARRERPVGLSFSPVHYALQSCLAIVALTYRRWARRDDGGRTFDPAVMTMAILAAVGCVLSGNRSPLIGISLSLALYLLVTAPRLLALALPLLFVAGLGVSSMADRLDGAGVRVAQRDDGSSSNRGTLRTYAYHLLADQPFGRGLAFDSRELGYAYLDKVKYMPNPMALVRWGLHNYYNNMLTRYGVLVLLLVPFMLPTGRAAAMAWLPFIPYLVHAFYHNDGPPTDLLLGWIIAAGAFLVTTARRPRLMAPQRWRRAFA